jgi:hypothetical protein
MIPIKEYARLALIIKKGSKINTRNNMPAPLKLLLKPLLNILRSILQVRNFTPDHLHVDIFSYEQSVLFVFDLHVAETDLGRDGQVGRRPVFWNARTAHLLLLLFL